MSLFPKLIHLSWFVLTTSLYILGHYRALGRVIHAKYLKQLLKTKKHLNFAASRENMKLVQQLDILADTLYIEVNIEYLLVVHTLKTFCKNNLFVMEIEDQEILFS